MQVRIGCSHMKILNTSKVISLLPQLIELHLDVRISEWIVWVGDNCSSGWKFSFLFQRIKEIRVVKEKGNGSYTNFTTRKVTMEALSQSTIFSSYAHSTTSVLYTEIISIHNHVDFIISCPGSMVTIHDTNTRIRLFTSNQTDYDSNYLALVELSYIWQENHRAPFFSYTSKLCKANLWATSKFLLQILKVVINWWAFKQCKLHIQQA